MNVENHGIVSIDNEIQFADNGIVSRTIMKTDEMRVVLFGFDKGQELSEHTSPFMAWVQIITGEAELSLGGERHRVKAGDLIYMPPHLPHAVNAVERFSMLLTMVKPSAKAIN
ncbi:MAG: cupin domain-containing protein [Verrucomicrobia bacterium]|nr:cupin domain-containing protein [Verrucomicrobiota bacterium]